MAKRLSPHFRFTRLAHTRQAIENLEHAITELETKRASEADLKPYRDNLTHERAKLEKLLEG